MAKPDLGATSAEFQRRDLKTRQKNLANSLPNLFSHHQEKWVRDAWGVHLGHQNAVIEALSTVFAAETSSELRNAISGQLTQFRTRPPATYATIGNRDRIFAPVAPDEETLAQKLRDFTSAKEGTQGEKLLYDEKENKGPYPLDRDMEVAVGRRAVARLGRLWEEANRGDIHDLMRIKFAAALSIGQLGLLLPGQWVSAKQTLKSELHHITLLIRAGATTLEPSLDTKEKPALEITPETDVTGASVVVTRDQLPQHPEQSTIDELIASVRSNFGARLTPEAKKTNGSIQNGGTAATTDKGTIKDLLMRISGDIGE